MDGAARYPSLSVVLPLVDERKFAARAVSSWLDQRTAAQDFELVLVSNGRRPALEQRIERLVGANDRIVPCRSTNEAVLYNAGARAARGDVLMFSEAHVLAEPGAVAAIRRHFATTADAAASPATAHETPTASAQLDAGLFEHELPAMRALGAWRCVSLRGFAIRTPVFRALGLFDEAYGRFAETALAIHLVERGWRLGQIAGAAIRHVDTASPGHVAANLRLGAMGESAFWDRAPELARKYFGPTAPSARVWTPAPGMARQTCLALVRSWWSDLGRRGWRDAVESGFRLLPQLAGMLLGWRGQVLAARLAAEWTSWRLRHHLAPLTALPRGDCSHLLQLYLAMRQAWSHCGTVQYLTARSRSQAPERRADYGRPSTAMARAA